MQAPAPSSEILIDGFNLLHAVVLKGRQRAQWWSAENQSRVLSLVACYRASTESEASTVLVPKLCLVFDASESSQHRLTEQTGGTEHIAVEYAPHADDWIVARAEELRHTPPVIVSADRALLDRAARWGAGRISPWAFAEMCGISRD